LEPAIGPTLARSRENTQRDSRIRTRGWLTHVAKQVAQMSPEHEVDLKDPMLAGFLAWLWPGAGHLYQGRRAKGVLFMVVILGTFLYGLYIGEGRVVYAAWSSPHQRWHYFCQVATGLPAVPALVQTYRVKQGRAPLFSRHWLTPPQVVIPDNFQRSVLTWDLNDEQRRLHRFFDLGTVYTMIAGLLNILVIYDAVAGPAFESVESTPEGGDAKPKPPPGGTPPDG